MSREVTLDSVQHLGEPSKPLLWKDFGALLDKTLWRLDDKAVHKLSLSPSVIYNVLLDQLYLLQVVKYSICNSCNRPVGQDSLKTHYARCVEMKQKNEPKRKRGRAPADDTLLVDLTRVALPNPPSRPKKKYKKLQMQKEKEAANAAAAAAAAVEAAQQRANNQVKKKKLAKSKPTNKAKGPVDVERQCGVPLPLGGFCARSLTCKTHAMGAKRAVPGRLAPYDVLLQQYQKRNQAKIAALNALAAQKRENELETDDPGALLAVLDPDEETHLVLEGLLKNFPAPLERKVLVPPRHRHSFLYMREAYANAMIINGNGESSQGDLTLANQAILGLIGGLQGRCALVNVGAENASIPGELYQVRAALKAILMTAQYNQQQQQQFQQRVYELQQRAKAPSAARG